jgi:hypothetical protein
VELGRIDRAGHDSIDADVSDPDADFAQAHQVPLVIAQRDVDGETVGVRRGCELLLEQARPEREGEWQVGIGDAR